jgi:S-formylglutathione hydrolase FrmB
MVDVRVLRFGRRRVTTGWGLLTVVAVVAALLTTGASASGAQRAGGGSGRLVSTSMHSAALNGPIDFELYLPAGYATSSARYPTLYLLHGRGDSMEAWTREKADLDRLIRTGKIPPMIVVMPDAPWSGRGSWYVDSQYTGTDYPGLPVETALTRDLVGYMDSTYRTVNGRWGRAIGGYSMGGYGALRYVLAHEDLYSAAIVLSPAVYYPQPPADSSTRDYGAFGVGADKFVDSRYTELNYPALLSHLDTDTPVHLYLAVGDKEYVNPDPVDATHDLDFETAVVYNKLVRTAGVTADWRVLGGGHDWDVWTPSFVDGVQNIARYLSVTPPHVVSTPLVGTAGDDWAGGVRPDGTGSAVVAMAASGAVGGQAYAGGLDAVVSQRSAAGVAAWTTEFGTASDERLYGAAAGAGGVTFVVGYTNGDLDGHHASNTSGDVMAAAVDKNGKVLWKYQYGDATAADRGYAVAADGAGGFYVAGYTKGSVGGTANAGDKDSLLMRIDAHGTLVWSRELGGTGEDKALAVTTSADGHVYVGGVTSGAMPGGKAQGGGDGWVAAFTPTGSRTWLRQVGGTGDDQFNGLTVRPDGSLVAVGTTDTALAGPLLGGTDAIAMALKAGTGATVWQRQFGTSDNDAASAVVSQPGGVVRVVGTTNGRLAPMVGDYDLFASTLSARGAVQASQQLGTAAVDGLDSFGEANVFAAGAGSKLWISAVTSGNTTSTANAGGADVVTAQI